MCVRPFDIVIESRSSHKTRTIAVPCGKCVECQKRRQNDWKMRITKECESWSHVYFFTLTYKDSKLPCNVCYEDVYDDVLYHGVKPAAEKFAATLDGAKVYSTVDFDNIRTWLKRFRTNYERSTGKKWNCKYFICSEYGPNPRGTKRPHYHGIFMTDLSKNELQPMFTEWSKIYGRIQFDECGIKREDKSSVANYISKYCSKGCFESRSVDISYKRIKRAYSCMSKHIGLRWIESHANDWLKYVPSFMSFDGDWDIDMVECFFSRLAQNEPESYSKFMNELDNLIINLRMFDGDNFAYKIPRYYYNILFGKRINDVKPQIKTKNGNPLFDLRISPLVGFSRCFKSELQSFSETEHSDGRCTSLAYSYFPQPLTYVSKMAKNTRYVSSTFLSSAIAYRLRMQFLAKCKSDADILVKQGCTYDEAFSILCIREKRAALARQQTAESSLCRFYQQNMWKNRILDFDADTFDNQLFTNF